MTKLLNREAILKADDLPTRDVAVPEWGGTVRVRSLTARARDEIETAIIAARQEGDLSPGNVRARHAAACIVDEAGKTLFNEEDIAALGAKSGAAMARVYTAIVELNLIGDDQLEDAAKN